MMTPAQVGEMAVKLGLTALLSGLVGAEREWTGKRAGLRTHMVIAIGATLLTHISLSLGDSGRIAAQIVTGVGFLGAGTILQSRWAVHGLTTAAGVWVAAAIGIAVGAHFYGEAALATAALLLIQVALRPLERRLHHDERCVSIRLEEGQTLASLMNLLDEAHIDLEGLARTADPKTVLVRFRGSRQDAGRVVQLANAEGFQCREEKGGLAAVAGTPSDASAGSP
ncbi:MAG TPA: MgtC/SapB family protein [Thermoanaerobaculia bacterium]|nr:MgtC/SapB family protein [Thermoanaerobaculia bacterium]